MPVYLLNQELVFPPPEGATPEGVVAVGGDASPARLILAYSQGIFPWPARGMPLLWFSPDPRFVLPLDGIHISRSLRRAIRRQPYRITADQAFDDVVVGCAALPRRGETGTWITDELRTGYRALHEQGYAHSIEAWQQDQLVGGLYGVSLGSAFFGESMFATAPDASKVALVTLLGHLVEWGFTLVDCQVHTDHLARFGAREVPRRDFLTALRAALAQETHAGRWELSLTTAEAAARLKTPERAPDD